MIAVYVWWTHGGEAMMLRREEFEVLDKLRKTGALPQQLEQRHQLLRRQQLFAAGLEAGEYPPPATSSLEDPDMSVSDWLRERWTSADEAVRHSLRLLADALGIPLPLTRRTQPVPAQDSSPARRTKFPQQPYVEQDLAEMGPAEAAEPEEAGYHDPPEWHDDDADGWQPCTSLHDALHPEDRSWY